MQKGDRPNKTPRGQDVEAYKESNDSFNGSRDRYVLRLYVSGSTPRSARAITSIKKICEENLKDEYDLEVIDIFREKTNGNDNIIAVPTLIKSLPLPLRRLIGDLSDEKKVLIGLDIKKKDEV
jgi:circadian clock protein KaiB